MIPRLALLALGKIVGFPSRVRLWTFAAACRDPKQVQDLLLREILELHADTAFGRDHRFADIRSPADYCKNVPNIGYDYLEPYLARVRRGETKALLGDDRVLMFALTSGTTAARKTIPVTPRYLADYQRGWNRWGLRMFLDHQEISCSPMLMLTGDPSEYHTEAGTPCGSLSGLTSATQKRFVRFLYCMTSATSKVSDTATKDYLALRLSMPRPVGVITAANPSTLVSMARTLANRSDELLRDIADGTLSRNLNLPPGVREALQSRLHAKPHRAKQLAAIAAKEGVLRPYHVWPPERLLIGTWMGGSVGPYLRQVRELYGKTFLRDLGLVASEGRMTIPLEDDSASGVPDITTHYFEFIPEHEIDAKQPVTLGVHELELGEQYFMVPTTAAGLYRYDLHDLVRVTGFYGKTPKLEFLNKGSHIASLTGEKISEYQVTRAADSVTTRLGLPLPVYTLAPVWDERQPYYGFFVEAGAWPGEAIFKFLRDFDAALSTANTEYAAKRSSRRLGPVRAETLPPGTWSDWDQRRQRTRGGPAEQYKHPCLIGDVNFRMTMPVLNAAG